MGHTHVGRTRNWTAGVNVHVSIFHGKPGVALFLTNTATLQVFGGGAAPPVFLGGPTIR